MRFLALTLTLSLALLTACGEETAPKTTNAKIPAIQAAEKAATIATMSTAQKVYEDSCSSCHSTGAMNAPMLGDKQAWSNHMKKGLEHMVENAVNGVGQMPPKGGNMSLSTSDVKAAVEYIVEQSK